jgi:prepilin-type N-terminal cleavage/methylation domain-containing protein
MLEPEGGRSRISVRSTVRNSDGGFSLIELLIVIAILGVLAGIVVFAVGGFTDAGEDEACSTNQKSIITALEAFKSQSKKYTVTSPSPATSYSGYPDGATKLETGQFVLDWPGDWAYAPSGQVQAPPGTNVAVEISVDGSGTGVTTGLFDGYSISSTDCGISYSP